LTEQRRVFVQRWIWIGGAAALLIFLPNVLWNIHYHWPFLELMRNIRAEGRDVILPAGPYFFQQTILVNPLTAPIWITGLLAFLFSARLKTYRVLGWSYVVCYSAFFLLHGKNYYLAPIYPMLLGAGAVVIESAFTRPRTAWLKPVIVVLLLATGVHLAPVVVPILSPDKFLVYARSLPFKLPLMEHSHARAALPQWYADQFGWNEIVAETAIAWNRLSPDQRTDCGIVYVPNHRTDYGSPYAPSHRADCGIVYVPNHRTDYGSAYAPSRGIECGSVYGSKPSAEWSSFLGFTGNQSAGTFSFPR
jgi:hypothetical protein